MIKTESSFIAWILVIFASINTTLGNLFLKRSRMYIDDYSIWGLIQSYWFIGGLCFYGINVIVFSKSLDLLPISSAYPVLAGLGFVLITIAGHFLYLEKIEVTQIFGVGLILLGIILVVYKN